MNAAANRCLIITLIVALQPSDFGLAGEEEIACGPHSLALASNLLDCEIVDSDLSVAFGGRLNGVHSLKEVAAAAKHLGLTTRLVQLDPTAPNLEHLPFIAFIKRHADATQADHFVVFYGRFGKSVQILDYPNAPVLVPTTVLPRFWDGDGLYVVTSPRDLPFSIRATPWLSGVLVSSGLLLAVASVYLSFRTARRNRNSKTGTP